MWVLPISPPAWGWTAKNQTEAETKLASQLPYGEILDPDSIVKQADTAPVTPYTKEDERFRRSVSGRGDGQAPSTGSETTVSGGRSNPSQAGANDANQSPSVGDGNLSRSSRSSLSPSGKQVLRPQPGNSTDVDSAVKVLGKSVERISSRLGLSDEVIGHKGMAAALKGINPSGYTNLVKLLQNYKLENGASLWADVQGRYKGANDDTLFNEAIARLSENENRSAKEETLWKRIVSAVKLWLAQKGFKNYSDADITTLIRRSAEGLRNGTAQQSEQGNTLFSANRKDNDPVSKGITPDGLRTLRRLDAANQFNWLDNEAKARGSAVFQTLLENNEKAANILILRWRILHPRLDKTGEIVDDTYSRDSDTRLLKLTKETEGNPFPGRDARTHAQSAISFLQGSESVSGTSASEKARLVAGGQSQKSSLVN